ncbi:NTP transferase domain-containing protein [Nitriliruptoraceae bacterium ZYF776]|nr:NTP transferase domain-containing protein [Profundirhabdus halotolerans]
MGVQQVGDGRTGGVLPVTARDPVAGGDHRRRPSSAHAAASRAAPVDPVEPTDPAPRPAPVVAVVLAAGSSRRFGATKQLVGWDGRPLVTHAVAAARAASSVDRVVVVVGHDAAAVADVVRAAFGDVEVVVNRDHADGQASSLRVGLRAAAGAAAVVVLLGDEPQVAVATIDAVVAAVGGEVLAARAGYADGPGHPVAFAGRAVAHVAGSVTGDRGAGPLLAQLGVVEVPVGGVAPVDVDRPEDLPAEG